jgi:hypothetical protein
MAQHERLTATTIATEKQRFMATDNRLVAYGRLAGVTVLPIATAFATVRYESPHESTQVALGTWLMDGSPSGYLIVVGGWPRLVALAGVLIFLVSVTPLFLRRSRDRASLTARRAGAKFVMGQLLLLCGLMCGGMCGFTLPLALIIPHGVFITHSSDGG